MKKYLAILHCAKMFDLIPVLQIYLISSPLSPFLLCIGSSSEQLMSIHCLLSSHNITGLCLFSLQLSLFQTEKY